MEKAAKQPYRVADYDAIVEILKRELLKDRRERWVSWDVARELWNTQQHAVDRDDRNAEQLVRALYDDSAWYERLDCSDPSVMIDHPGMRRFWDEVWKPFCENTLRPHWEDYQMAKARQAEKAA